MNRTATTDYVVVSMIGHSHGGGYPDTTANKVMSRWYLWRDPEVSQLHEKALPLDTHRGAIKLKTWHEGNQLRGKLVVDDGQTETRLDQGIVANVHPMGETSTHRMLTLRPQYLLEVIIECKPIPDTSQPTATTVALKPSLSQEPLRSSRTNPDDATLTEILAGTEDDPLAKAADNQHSTSTTVIPTVSTGTQNMVAQQTADKPATIPTNIESTAAPVTKSASSQPEPSTPSTTKRKTVMKTTDKNYKPLIDWVTNEVAIGLGITLEQVFDRTERRGVGVTARQLTCHILKNIMEVKPLTVLSEVFTPGNDNTGAIYGVAAKGSVLAKQAAYKKLVEKISADAKKSFSQGGTPPLVVPPAASTKPALNGSSNASTLEACIYTLITVGTPVVKVAEGFGITEDAAWAAFGRMTHSNSALAQKIRASVPEQPA